MLGFDTYRRRNAHGGGDLVPYSSMSLEEIDNVLTSTNLPWQPATILPDKYTKAGPKEHRAKLAAIHKEFREVEQACEPLGVGNADKLFAQWKADAIKSGNPGDAPADKNEVKDRCRNLRRELRGNFKAKHFRAYHELIRELLEAILPGLTKLIEKENAEDAARLNTYGIPQAFPSPAVAGLFAVRRYLIGQLVFAENSLESEQVLSSLNVDPELLRFVGCDL
jgi:hypothetical protein